MSKEESLCSRDEAVMLWCDLAVLPGAGTFFYCAVPQAGVTVTAHHEELWDTALRGQARPLNASFLSLAPTPWS